MKYKGYMYFTYFAKENEKYELWDILICSTTCFLFFAVLQISCYYKAQTQGQCRGHKIRKVHFYT